MWVLDYKNVDSRRIYAFELWCLRRLLKVPWTARRSNQWILQEINFEYSLEGCWSWSSNTLAELTPLKTYCCWERLRAGGKVGDRGWDILMVSLIEWTWVWANSRGWWRTGKPGMLQSMESHRVRHDLVTEQQQFCTNLFEDPTEYCKKSTNQ